MTQQIQWVLLGIVFSVVGACSLSGFVWTSRKRKSHGGVKGISLQAVTLMMITIHSGYRAVRLVKGPAAGDSWNFREDVASLLLVPTLQMNLPFSLCLAHEWLVYSNPFKLTTNFRNAWLVLITLSVMCSLGIQDWSEIALKQSWSIDAIADTIQAISVVWCFWLAIHIIGILGVTWLVWKQVGLTPLHQVFQHRARNRIFKQCVFFTTVFVLRLGYALRFVHVLQQGTWFDGEFSTTSEPINGASRIGTENKVGGTGRIYLPQGSVALGNVLVEVHILVFVIVADLLPSIGLIIVSVL